MKNKDIIIFFASIILGFGLGFSALRTEQVSAQYAGWQLYPSALVKIGGLNSITSVLSSADAASELEIAGLVGSVGLESSELQIVAKALNEAARAWATSTEIRANRDCSLWEITWPPEVRNKARTQLFSSFKSALHQEKVFILATLLYQDITSIFSASTLTMDIDGEGNKRLGLDNSLEVVAPKRYAANSPLWLLEERLKNMKKP
jgi:hypothetical protein